MPGRGVEAHSHSTHFEVFAQEHGFCQCRTWAGCKLLQLSSLQRYTCNFVCFHQPNLTQMHPSKKYSSKSYICRQATSIPSFFWQWCTTLAWITHSLTSLPSAVQYWLSPTVSCFRTTRPPNEQIGDKVLLGIAFLQCTAIESAKLSRIGSATRAILIFISNLVFCYHSRHKVGTQRPLSMHLLGNLTVSCSHTAVLILIVGQDSPTRCSGAKHRWQDHHRSGSECTSQLWALHWMQTPAVEEYEWESSNHKFLKTQEIVKCCCKGTPGGSVS